MSAPDGPRLGHLIDALSAHADVTSLAEVLATSLASVLPADVVSVARERSAGDRLRGRPGRVSSVTVHTGDRDLVLAGREASVTHTVRGVVLSRRTVPIDEWLTLLAAEIDHRAAAEESARAALDRFLLG